MKILLFLDFSGGEFLLIAVVFLMFFGSKSIPGAARALGKAVREFKEAASTVQREIEEGVKMEEPSSKPPQPSSIQPPPSQVESNNEPNKGNS